MCCGLNPYFHFEVRAWKNLTGFGYGFFIIVGVNANLGTLVGNIENFLVLVVGKNTFRKKLKYG